MVGSAIVIRVILGTLGVVIVHRRARGLVRIWRMPPEERPRYRGAFVAGAFVVGGIIGVLLFGGLGVAALALGMPEWISSLLLIPTTVCAIATGLGAFAVGFTDPPPGRDCRSGQRGL